MIKSIFSLVFFGWRFFASLQAFSPTDRLSEFYWTNLEPTSGQKSDFANGNKVYIKSLYDFFEQDFNTWEISHPDYLNDR